MNLSRPLVTAVIAAGMLVSTRTSAQESACPSVPQPIPQDYGFVLCQLDGAPQPIVDTADFGRLSYIGCPLAHFHVRIAADGAAQLIGPPISSARNVSLCNQVFRSWQFTPATRHGTSVTSELVIKYEYVKPGRTDRLWDAEVDWLVARDTAAVKIHWSQPPASRFAVLSEMALDSALAAVVRAWLPADSTPLCVHVPDAFRGGVAALLAESSRPFLVAPGCPAELQGSVSVGWVYQMAAANSVVANISVAYGYGGSSARCRATRATTDWEVRCQGMSVW